MINLETYDHLYCNHCKHFEEKENSPVIILIGLPKRCKSCVNGLWDDKEFIRENIKIELVDPDMVLWQVKV